MTHVPDKIPSLPYSILIGATQSDQRSHPLAVPIPLSRACDSSETRIREELSEVLEDKIR